MPRRSSWYRVPLRVAVRVMCKIWALMIRAGFGGPLSYYIVCKLGAIRNPALPIMTNIPSFP